MTIFMIYDADTHPHFTADICHSQWLKLRGKQPVQVITRDEQDFDHSSPDQDSGA